MAAAAAIIITTPIKAVNHRNDRQRDHVAPAAVILHVLLLKLVTT